MPEDSAGPEVPRAEPSLIAIAGEILLDPTAVGESVARRPGGLRALGAFVVLLAIVLTSSLLTLRQQKAMVIEVSRTKLAKMPAEQRAKVEEVLDGPMGETALVVSAAGSVVLGVPLIAFLLYLGQLAMGGRATFEMALSVALYACLVSLGLGTIVRTALVLIKDSFMDVSTGLGLLVADRPLNDPLRAVLDVLNPFVLAATIAGGVALGPPAKLPRAYTVGVALFVWMLLVGGGAFARMMQ